MPARSLTSLAALAVALAAAPALAQVAPVPVATTQEVVVEPVPAASTTVVPTDSTTVVTTTTEPAAPPAAAQPPAPGDTVVVTTTTTTTEPPAHAGAFDALPPGGQKIARALYTAQGGTAAGWSMDDIAAARAQGGGWGKVFSQMKADGAITAKNLGQVVSGHHQPAAPVVAVPADTGAATVATRQTPVVVSYGSGATSVTAGAAHAPRVAATGVHGGGHAAAVAAASAQAGTVTTAAGAGGGHGNGAGKGSGKGK